MRAEWCIVPYIQLYCLFLFSVLDIYLHLTTIYSCTFLGEWVRDVLGLFCTDRRASRQTAGRTDRRVGRRVKRAVLANPGSSLWQVQRAGKGIGECMVYFRSISGLF